MSASWDEKTERRINHTDHDTLIELVQIIRNQTETTRDIANRLKEHEKENSETFNSIRKDILDLQKAVWIAVGVIISVNAIPKIMQIMHMIPR